ncbi:hypothetical protein ALPO108162_06115 [Alicyclobacillus pomorum]
MSVLGQTKKTIHEWEKELNIKLLDLDGFDVRDDQLFTRLFTRKEFEKSAAECTIMKVQEVPSVQEEPKVQQVPRVQAVPKVQQVPRVQEVSKVQEAPKVQEVQDRISKPTQRRRYKLYIVPLVLFTMPVVATVIVSFIFRAITRLINIRWYVPVSILLVDVAMLLIQPNAAVLSGPFFLWYHLFNMLYHQWLPFWTHVRYSIFHQPLNLIDTDKPLFYDVEIHGTPLYLYFGLPQAITSSLFWATSIASVKHLLINRRRRDGVRR